jgi:hypothetical protein
MRAEAGLRRQPLRCLLVLVAWGSLAALSLNGLLAATDGMALPFVLLAAVLAFAAAFSTNPTTRLLAATALLLGATLLIAHPYDVLAGASLALVSACLIAGAIPALRAEMAAMAELDRHRKAARRS